MNKKKTVILHVSHNEQYFGEFYENTKIRMIKSFLKDVSHSNKFKLTCNGNSCNNDEISLKEMSRAV